MTDLPPWPQVDFASYGDVEVQPLPRMRKIAGGFLSRNWVTIPHVTHHDDADITALEAARVEYAKTLTDVKLTLLPLLVKAIVAGLRAFPQFNASLDLAAGTVVLKKYFHVGIAIDTPAGLLVAVIRDCDRKSIADIAREIAVASDKARKKGLSFAEMSGGCFTISSLGAIGGTGFTPIINAPEVAILGVCRATEKPTRAADDQIDWRLMLPLSLSYDHRVINGADAARFTRHLAETLAAPRALLE